HTATLYLETYFNRGYESSRLFNQLKLQHLQGDERPRIKQSAKMCYVGMSRPTHLLCVAVHKSRYESFFAGTNIDDKWKVVFVSTE
ncbi:MAG: hypothetical protein AAFO07_32980, partial [Bacteroidota bacterium]